MVAFLSRPYSLGEIQEAIKHLASTKSPGPNLFPALFYQKYQNVVGSEVSHSCLQVVLNNGARFASFNRTFIALIPKVSYRILAYKPLQSLV